MPRAAWALLLLATMSSAAAEFIGTVRKTNPPTGLHKLAVETNGQLHVEIVDITVEDQVELSVAGSRAKRSTF